MKQPQLKRKKNWMNKSPKYKLPIQEVFELIIKMVLDFSKNLHSASTHMPIMKSESHKVLAYPTIIFKLGKNMRDLASNNSIKQRSY